MAVLDLADLVSDVKKLNTRFAVTIKKISQGAYYI